MNNVETDAYFVSKDVVRNFMFSVFAWMSLGLAITGFTSYAIYSNSSWMLALQKNPLLLFLIVILQFAVVIILSRMLHKISYLQAVFLFVAYSFMSGVTFSFIFLLYTESSIQQVFLIAAGMFLAAAFYGYFTNADFSKFGPALTMALFGLIIALVVNLFLRSSMFELILSLFGVILFAALTVYDVNRLKKLASDVVQVSGDKSLMKLGLLGALALYLDFLNLFLFLLNLMGKRKN